MFQRLLALISVRLSGMNTQRFRSVRWIVESASCILTVLCLLQTGAWAATQTVSNTNDSGTGSLRWAVANAGNGDTVDATGITGVIRLTTGQISISSAITIQGPGARWLSITNASGGTNRIFFISGSVPSAVNLSGLTIAGGNAGGAGGGGIVNLGTLSVIGCVFQGNSGTNGGAIANLTFATLTVDASTFSYNSAVTTGGGIYNEGALTVRNSTFAGNNASLGAGLYLDGGNVRIINSTISRNTVTTDGAGVYYSSGVLSIANNIVAGNTGGSDCLACPSTTGNMVGGSPALGPLTWNGGNTTTMVPMPGSGAIGAGTSGQSDLPVVDQRGRPRMVNGSLDMGAVQTNYLTVTSSDSSGAGTLNDTLAAVGSNGADLAFDSTVFASSTTITVTAPMTLLGSTNIIGPVDQFGAPLLQLYGSNGEILQLASSENASINNLIFSGVSTAIDSQGDLTVSNSEFNWNYGGAISSSSALVIANSTFNYNSGQSGGAVFNSNGQLMVTNSTFGNNSATNGGAIFSSGATAIVSSTISSNTANAGGGLYSSLGSLQILNSIIAGNTDNNTAGDDCDAYTCSMQDSHNLIMTSGLSTTIDPQLGPMIITGPRSGIASPLLTMIPLPGSPAICAGNVTSPGLLTASDERGYSRTTTYPGATSACVDLGSVQTHYARVAFATQPTDTAAGQAITPAVITGISEYDATTSFGWIGDNGIPLTVALGSGDPGTLGGTTTQTTSGAGGATYSDLTVSAPGTGDTLTMTVPVTTPPGASKPYTLTATSNTFNVTATTSVTITVGTSPAGLWMNVDGTIYYTTQTFTWIPGSSHTLIAASTLAGTGALYSFSDWTDGTSTINATTDTITVPYLNAAYTAQYSAAYSVTLSANNPSYGTVSPVIPPNNYYGGNLDITATPNAGYYFINWTGSSDIFDPNSSTTFITVRQPEVVTANFAVLSSIPSVVVTTATDTTTGTAANCPGSNCSLRDALATGTAKITFSPTVFTSPVTLTLANGTLNVATETSITGPMDSTGAPLVTIDGGGTVVILATASGASGVAFSNLKLVNGAYNTTGGGATSNSTGGAAIQNNFGSMTVNNCFLNNNAGTSARGGAIYNEGTLTINNSSITNSIGWQGGAIFSSGTLNMNNSTVANGTSYNGSGVAVFNYYGGILNITNSTFTGNVGTGPSQGGAIYSLGTVTINDSTFTGNSAYQGGAIYNTSGSTVTLLNSIVAGNTSGSAAGDDCDNCGPQDSHNLISTTTTVVNPMLGALQLNGSSALLPTMLPLPMSPAICAGDATKLNGLTTDERSFPRTTQYSGAASACLDLGAAQTNYSAISFVQQPTNAAVAATITPAVTTELLETNSSTSKTDPVAGIPLTVVLNGSGTLSGTLTEISGSNGLVTYNDLAVNAAGTDTLTISLPILTLPGASTPLTLTGASSSFQIGSTLLVPTVTLSITPGSQIYGTPLPSSAITASATYGGNAVTGTFAYRYMAQGGSWNALVPNATVLPVGSYTVEADFTPGSTGYQSASATASYVVTPATPGITWNAPSSIVYGTSLSSVLNATATATTPAGSIAYTEAGRAVTASTVLAVGSHTLTATFTTTDPDYSSSATKTVTVQVTQAAASVTPNAASKSYGQSDPSLNGTLTGFLAADNIVATYTRAAGETVGGGPYIISATLSPLAALANYTITYNTAQFTISKANASVTPTAATKVYGAQDPTLIGTLSGFVAADSVTASYSRAAGETVGGGPYTITATLSPLAALANYNVTYNTGNFNITPASLTANGSNAGMIYGAAVPTLSGTVSGVVGNDGITAAYTTTATSTAAVGSYAIVPQLADPNSKLSNYSVTLTNGTLTITPEPTKTTLALSAATIMLQSSVTLAVTVSGSTAMPTGTVTFLDGTNSLGTGTLDRNGTASLTLSTLTAGTHNITASYTGTSNFAASTSAASTETVQDFQLNASGGTTTATVNGGTNAQFTVPIAPTSGQTFIAPITLTLSGLPSGSTATISPASIAAASAATTVTISVTTSNQMAALRPAGRAHGLPTTFAVLACCIPLLSLRRLRSRLRSRRVQACIMAAVTLLLAAFMAACGSGSTQKSYTLTLNAASGSLQHSVTLQLTVKK